MKPEYEEPCYEDVRRNIQGKVYNVQQWAVPIPVVESREYSTVQATGNSGNMQVKL